MSDRLLTVCSERVTRQAKVITANRDTGTGGAIISENIHPEKLTILVRELVRALRERGLTAEPFGATMAWVANRAADPDTGHGSPGLRQAVLCRVDDQNRLGWWWVWTGRDGGPEHEWLCPAAEITTAADAIARVLAVREAGERVGG